MHSQKNLTKRVLGLVVLMAVLFSCFATASASTEATAAPTEQQGTVFTTSSDAAPDESMVPNALPELGLKFAPISDLLESLKVLLYPSMGQVAFTTAKVEPKSFVQLNYANKTLTDIIATQDAFTAATKDLAPEQIGQLFESNMRTICSVVLFDEATWDEQIGKGLKAAEIVGVNDVTELGRKNGYVYIIAKGAASADGLSDADKAEYETVTKDVESKIGTIELMEIPAGAKPVSSGEGFPKFDAKDLDGNAVTNDLFAKNKMTIINFWGTFCTPCIEEMPDLGKIAKELPEGVQLIGVVVDANESGNVDVAKQIIEKTQANYLHIVPDATLDVFSRTLQGVPTTYFVDSQGNIVGEMLLGSRDKASFEAEVQNHLKLIP